MRMLLPVSLIIPMFNEAATLPSLFAALGSLTAYPSEIIFVDAGSSDGTPDMVNCWWQEAAWPGGTCRVLSRRGAMPGGGRNAGIREAGHEWIAFLDAGIQPEPVWLVALFCFVQKQKVQGAYGVSRFSADTPVSKAICALSYGCGAIHPVLPASIFHRQVFEVAGLFMPDLRAGEDLLWLKTYEKVYGPRKVCWDAVVNYRYFPVSIENAVRKWFIYEMHAVAAGISLGRKSAYMLFLTAVMFSVFLAPVIGVPLLIAYIVARGCIGPIRRSADRPWWRGSWPSVGIAFVCGPLLDIAKMCGYLAGMHRKIPGKRNRHPGIEAGRKEE